MTKVDECSYYRIIFMTMFLLSSVQTNSRFLAPKVTAMVTSFREHCLLTVSVSVWPYEYINISYHDVLQNKSAFCNNTSICKIHCQWYLIYIFHIQISRTGFPDYHGNWTFKANKIIYKHEKLGQFQISATNTESLWLSYGITDSYDKILASQPYLYRIFYKSEWDQSLKNYTTNQTEIKLENLVPYTTYTIHGQVKPKESIYWSDNLTLTERTLPSAPYAGPNSTNGSYLETTCAKKSKRCFILYWAMIPMPLRNGIFYRYVIQQDNRTLLKTSEIYGEINDQPQYKDLWFEIRSQNNNSQLSPPTVIHIPPAATERPKGVSVVRLNNTHVNISWTLEQSLKNVAVTVMTCLGEKTCKSDVMWTKIQNKNFTILEAEGATNFLVAAYVSNSEGSSSLTFAECILSGGISNKPKIPEIGETYPHQVDLRWPIYRCRDLFGRPTMFQILYAEGNTCRNGLRMDIPAIGTKPETVNIKIKELKPFTKYFVCLRIQTEQGWSQESPQVEISTAETNPGSSVLNLKVVGITFSSVTLRWNSTLQPNGIITHHFVYYDKLQIYTNTSNMATVYHLKPNSKYNFAVSTCNNAGCSKNSIYVTATTLNQNENLLIIAPPLLLFILSVICCCYFSRWMWKKWKKIDIDIVYPDEIEDEPSSASLTKLIEYKNGEVKPDDTKIFNSRETVEKIQEYTTPYSESHIKLFNSKSGDFRITGEGQNINLYINDGNSKKSLEMVHLNANELSRNMHIHHPHLERTLSSSIFSQADLDSNSYVTQDNLNLSGLSQDISDSNHHGNNDITLSELSLNYLDLNINKHEMKSELSQANSELSLNYLDLNINKHEMKSELSQANSELSLNYLDLNINKHEMKSELSQANSELSLNYLDLNINKHEMKSELSQANSDTNEQDDQITSSKLLQAMLDSNGYVIQDKFIELDI